MSIQSQKILLHPAPTDHQVEFLKNRIVQSHMFLRCKLKL